MNATERSIFGQFGFLHGALAMEVAPVGAALTVVVGCGSSFYLAQTLAAALTAAGRQAMAVTGGEWWRRPQFYVAPGVAPNVILLSRSGETTETIRAAERSLAAGMTVTVLTCAQDSSLTRHADRVLFTPSHPDEGVVMTCSASLMLLMGLRLAGIAIAPDSLDAAERLMIAADDQAKTLLAGRSHFVVLGSGPLAGIAQEGALKFQEMSHSYTQAYTALDYRHGPMTLAGAQTLAVLLYSPDDRGEEAVLAREIIAQGAMVLGVGGPGSVRLDPEGDAATRPLVLLPALQVLGERLAQAKSLDTGAPLHLRKVIVLDEAST